MRAERRPTAPIALVVILFAAVSATGAIAADWGGVIPGESTMETVRGRYGPPTKTSTQKTDSYESTQWVYDGADAPTGMFRMTIDFGLLSPTGYRANVVRTFKLEPHPGIFNRAAIIDGWGRPSGAAPPGETPAFFYESGLLVYFDKDGWEAQAMIFTPPQPSAGGGAPPR